MTTRGEHARALRWESIRRDMHHIRGSGRALKGKRGFSLKQREAPLTESRRNSHRVGCGGDLKEKEPSGKHSKQRRCFGFSKCLELVESSRHMIQSGLLYETPNVARYWAEPSHLQL